MQPIVSTSGAQQIQTPGVARPPATAVRRPDTPLPSGVAAAPAPGPTDAQIKQAIEAANTALRQVTSDLEFAMDATTGKTVMRVIDSNTQQVIRQFPSEEMLAIARALDRFQGLLIRQKA